MDMLLRELIMFILLILLFSTVSSINIGLISNTKFVSVMNQMYLNVTSLNCTCMALMNLSVAWNYFTVNRSCNLIGNYSSNDIGIQTMNNSTFYFRKFPPQSITTVPTGMYFANYV